MRKRRWEQRYNSRPAQRSMASRSRRERYTQADLDAQVLDAMEAARLVGEKIARHECEKEMRKLLDAFENGQLDEFRRKQRGEAIDRLMDVAQAAGVTPLDDSRAGKVGDDMQEWLAARDAYLAMLHEDERAAGRRCTWQCWRCNVERGE